MTDRLPHEKGFHVSWDQIHRDSRALAWRLDGHGPNDGAWRAVVAITRGGMAPAMIVARELDIRAVDTISVKSYDNQTQSEASILKSPDMTLMGDGTGIKSAFCNGVRQAKRRADGGHVHHWRQPGHMDLFPLGHGLTVCRAVSRNLVPTKHILCSLG